MGTPNANPEKIKKEKNMVPLSGLVTAVRPLPAQPEKCVEPPECRFSSPVIKVAVEAPGSVFPHSASGVFPSSPVTHPAVPVAIPSQPEASGEGARCPAYPVPHTHAAQSSQKPSPVPVKASVAGDRAVTPSKPRNGALDPPGKPHRDEGRGEQSLER